MIDLGAAYKPCWAANAQSIVRCWKITTKDTFEGETKTWRFTEAQRSTVVNEGGGTFADYDATAIAWAAAHRRVAGFRDNKAEITLFVGTGTNPLTQEDVDSGFLVGAQVDEYWINPERPWLPEVFAIRWRIADHDEGKGAITCQLIGLTSRLKIRAGDDLGPSCRNQFGLGRCDWASAITSQVAFQFRSYLVYELAGGNTRRTFGMRGGADFFPAAGVAEANWWAHGRMGFTSGPNQGAHVIIESNTLPVNMTTHYETEVTLQTPLAHVPTAGDVIMVQVGCDKAHTTCKDKFANFDNFRGFEHMPGSDTMQRTPSAQ